MSNNKKINNAGFTLIELLIVIAIIGILSALLMVNFIGIRQRGRDAQRKSNIRQIQSALELYRTDQSNYPNPQLPSCGNVFSASGTTYMQVIPCDPNGGSYYYTSNGSTYTLASCIENKNDSDPNVGSTPPPSPPTFTCTNGYYFIVNNP